jgi:hypothetical protein
MAMKVLRYWKTMNMPGVPGVTFTIVPVQEIRESEMFFQKIFEAVKAEEFDYTLDEVKEIERREIPLS